MSFKPRDKVFDRFNDADYNKCLNKTYKVLEFQNLEFTRRGFTDLCNVLISPKCSIHTLSLSHSININFDQLCTSIVKNPKTRLYNLNLSYTKILDLHCQYLGVLIENNTSLNILNLNNNLFNERGLKVIYKSYEKNRYLQDIFLFGMDQLTYADKTIYLITRRNKNNNDLKKLLSNTVTQEKSVRWGRSKLMVIGQGRAGKTSVVRALLGKDFDSKQESTIGADLKKTETSNWEEEDFMTSNFNEAAAKVLLNVRNKEADKFKKIIKEYEKENLNAKKLGKDYLYQDEEEKKKKKEEEEGGDGDKINGNKGKKEEKARPLLLAKGEEKKEKENGKIGGLGGGKKKLEIDEEVQITSDLFNRDKKTIISEVDVARRFGKKLLAKAVTNEKEQDPNKVTFTIWDYGGQEVFYTLHHLFLTKYGVYLIVFDMTELIGYCPRNINVQQGDQISYADNEFEINEAAVKYLKFWINSVSLHAPRAPVLLVGTHLDTIPDLFTKPFENNQEIKKFINDSKNKAYEKFMKAYLLQVNKALIHNVKVLNNPKVIKPSTFNSNKSDTKKEKEQEEVFFAVDNKNKAGIQQLRKFIELSAKNEYYIEQKIPLRWILACDFLLEDEDIQSNWHFFKDVVSWSKEFGCTSKDEVKNFLKLFHELGVLIYLSHSEILREKVISEPQWLIDKIGLLIRDDELHGIPKEIPKNLIKEYKRLREEGLVSKDILEYLWGWKNNKPKAIIRKIKKQERKGKLKKKKEGKKGGREMEEILDLVVEEKKQIEFMLELMSNAMLLSKWSYIDDIKEKYYFIPCLLKESFKNREEKYINELKSFEEKENEIRRLVLDFSGFFLPVGVFQRLICLLNDLLSTKIEERLNYLSSSNQIFKKRKFKKKEIKSFLKKFQPIIGKDYAFLYLPLQVDVDKKEKSKPVEIKGKSVKKGEEDEEVNFGKILLREEEDEIEVLIENNKDCSFVLEVILSLIHKLRAESMGSKLEIKISLSSKDKEEMIEYRKVKESEEEEFKVWFNNEKKTEEITEQVLDLEGFLEA